MDEWWLWPLDMREVLEKECLWPMVTLPSGVDCEPLRTLEEGNELSDGCREREAALPVEFVLGRIGSTVAIVSAMRAPRQQGTRQQGERGV